MNQMFRILLLSLSVALITLSGCQSYYQAKETENLSCPINPEIATDASPTAKTVAATIEPYQSQLSKKMEEVIARAPLTLEKDRPESRLGNWTAELIQQAAVDLFPDVEIAFSIQNYGGLRIRELVAGPVTVRNIYELMPFDNELVAVELNGFVLQEFIDHMAADGGWPGGIHLRRVSRQG